MNRILGLAISIVVVMSLAHNGDLGNTATYAASNGGHPNKIQQLIAAWNSHDPDKVAAAFTEDAVYEDVAAGHVSRGRAELRKWAEGGFGVFGNFKMEAVSSSYHNGRGVTEWVWSATDKGQSKTGKRFSVRGVSVFEVRKGKISRCRDYYDVAAIMRQPGLLPAEKE